MNANGTTERATRTEHDLLGTREVPADAYWGIHTLRAFENFGISGQSLATHPDLVSALALVKQAAAATNGQLRLLERRRAAAITEACEEIRSGSLHEAFVVDVIQGGAGTSTNMNVNEVVANRALEKLGHAKGEYEHVHPLEHVNLGQSTNDVYPTAVRLAVHAATERLVCAVDALYRAFQAKAQEFDHTVKIGRTQLQEAVPMTLGQEFGAYADTLAAEIDRLRDAQKLLRRINLGATAIGTSINTHPRYVQLVAEELSGLAGLSLVTAPNLIEATQDASAFVHVSGALRGLAVKLSKIANDLRLLSSGPVSGFAELRLPAVQAGSSIMPGKVNPVIPETVNQVAFETIGHDITVTMAAEAGQLQLNAFEPIIAHCLLTSARHLTASCTVFAERCVSGIAANTDQLRATVRGSIGLATALTPVIGYHAASQVAKLALETGVSVAELVRSQGLIDEERLSTLLKPESLTGSVEGLAVNSTVVAPGLGWPSRYTPTSALLPQRQS
ncbi:aspartate ammonia-lyase [Saccharopolyspora sp. ASAGF58]|uniref:aspartate ammonia-lyase n=1 Tax=Saccharopolyspora sp. ASAGF58 TaxID=2719023 RepID=UPI00143FDAB9|nr:aspartate ammonia-lyase [Saccharopolyspora sp. ASAGF58]QIZ39769.1 aspartate ammonia-lyase [Saccharopolyspora sp. ASAGF58]